MSSAASRSRVWASPCSRPHRPALPVVVGHSGGSKDTVVADRTGLLVRADDTEALAAGIADLLLDQARASDGHARTPVGSRELELDPVERAAGGDAGWRPLICST